MVNQLLTQALAKTPTCPQCGSNSLYRVKGRKVFSCPRGHHTSPLAATSLRKSATAPDKWRQAFLMLRSNRTTTCIAIQQAVQVTYKTAWRMKHLIVRNFAEFDWYFSPLNWASEEAASRPVTVVEDVNPDDLITEVYYKYKEAAAESRRRIIEKYGVQYNH